MGRKTLKSLIFVLCGILAAELVFGIFLHFSVREREQVRPTRPGAAQLQNPATEGTRPSETAGELPTADSRPTEGTVPGTAPADTEPVETEPGEIRYVLTFTGDCTLGSEPGQFESKGSFVHTIGTDYDYPFRNVADIFRNDDFTIINLESVLADSGSAAGKLFTFRGPTAYTRIMTGSSVEAVTLANNHTMDFGKAGYESTTKALTDAGIAYVEEGKTTLYTTESGLIIGLYADSFYFSNADIQKNVKSLKDRGAEIIICAFHWGTEGSYRATAAQQGFARAAIDAGADIVYGHHPHVLQRIESYNDGIIFYSLGNFSFGGNHFPRDMDSAIMQQEVIRDENGQIRLGALTILPVSISSMKNQNNFQPILLAEDSAEYSRVMSKLDGTFKGADLVVNYDHLKPSEPTAPTAPPTEAPGGDEVTEPGEGGGQEPQPPATEGGSEDSGSQTPPPPPEEAPTPPPAEGREN